MSLVLGIDTGGTYTDAVILEEKSKTIIQKAKALTTHQQLELGICQAIAAVLAKAGNKPEELALVSVSTTLATNAVVEDSSRRICAVLIGFEKSRILSESLRESLRFDSCLHLKGGHDSQGEALENLDLEPLLELLKDTSPFSGFALCSYFSVRNPEHELAAKALISKHSKLPISCSHELSSDLDAPKRALTTILNARLIGLLADFIKAIEASLSNFKITAPMMIVKGDGSLIRAEEAKYKAIETIYSGPAASLVGACYLAGVKDAVIADIGGTTTDIAILRGGQPKLNPQGVRIGHWRTMVKAVDMQTFGLGGDSEIRLEPSGMSSQLYLGPKRVIPLSLLALEHKTSIAKALEEQMNDELSSEYNGYFVLKLDANCQGLNESEKALLQNLGTKAQPLRKLIGKRRDRVIIQRLVSLKKLALSALTPSDAAHVLGLHHSWDKEIAEKAAELFARQRDKRGLPIAQSALELCHWVYRRVVEQSADLLIDSMLENEGLKSSSQHELIRKALAPEQNLLRLKLSLGLPIIALGASAQIYYPDVGKRLDTLAIIPEHADVANAVGAVMGLVHSEQEILVSGIALKHYRVHHPSQSQDFHDLAAALGFAEQEALRLAKEKAEAAGAGNLEYSLERLEKRPKIGEEELFLEARIIAKGFGRPKFDQE